MTFSLPFRPPLENLASQLKSTLSYLSPVPRSQRPEPWTRPSPSEHCGVAGSTSPSPSFTDPNGSPSTSGAEHDVCTSTVCSKVRPSAE